MKIMLVSRVVAEQRPGGMPHVASDRAYALAAEGHDVHLVTTSSGPSPGVIREYTRVRLDDNLTLHHVPSKAHEWSAAFGVGCKKMAWELMPDVVHLDSFDRDNAWWRGLPDSVNSLAMTMHGFGWGAFLTQWNMHRIGKRAGSMTIDARGMLKELKSLSEFTRVIGVSLHEHRMLRDEYGLSQARLVYNPLPQYFFDTPKVAVRKWFLCAAISQGETRGFEVAGRAARIAKVELKVFNKVKRSEMPVVYDQAIAVVLPTAFGQGFDLAVCEARTRGTPAIMSATGSYLAEAREWDELVGVHNVDDMVRSFLKMVDSDRHVIPQDDVTVTRHRPADHVREWLKAIR